MKYNDFKIALRESIQRIVDSRFVGGYEVSLTKVTKNNGKVLDAIVITKGKCEISPTIYIKDFYNSYMSGESMEETCEKVLNTYVSSSLEPDINVDAFKSYKKIKGRIVYKLINTKANKELLKKVPHKTFCDLSMVYYCIMDEKMESRATELIHNAHITLWGITREELHQQACQNTPFVLPAQILPMDDILKELLTDSIIKEDKSIYGLYGEDKPNREEYEIQAEEIMGNLGKKDDFLKLYVISNKNRIFGAACILYDGVLREFAKKHNEKDVYIIPSSIHEAIILSENIEVEKEYIKDIIKEVNATDVDECDVLSNNLYKYNYEKDIIEVV
mgnify:CR=1 FL=1